MRDPVMRAMEGGGQCRAGVKPLQALLLFIHFRAICLKIDITGKKKNIRMKPKDF